MLLTLTELERLTLFYRRRTARSKRAARGLALNHPEVVALIADEILEAARDGRSVAEAMASGATALTTADVPPGVAAMVPDTQVEAAFPDGTKSRHRPRADPPPPAGAEVDALRTPARSSPR